MRSLAGGRGGAPSTQPFRVTLMRVWLTFFCSCASVSTLVMGGGGLRARFARRSYVVPAACPTCSVRARFGHFVGLKLLVPLPWLAASLFFSELRFVFLFEAALRV